MKTHRGMYVVSWLVIGWNVKPKAIDRRCFDSEEGARRFIREFQDRDKWTVLHGPEAICTRVEVPV